MNLFKKYGFTFFKWFVFILSLGYLFYRIFYQQDLKNIFSEFQTESLYKWLLLLLVVLLMFVNWGIEAIKWKFVVKNISSISLKRAIGAVFAGTSVSLFMPNRTGEFVGRIFALPVEKRIQGILASFVTGFAQFNITLIAGTTALCLLYSFYPENIFTQHGFESWVIILSWATTLLCFVLYFRVSWFSKLFSKFRFIEKYSEKIKVLESYLSSELLAVLLLSLIRYTVFLFQFYMVVLFFGIDITLLNGLIASSLTFYIVTVIPTFSIAEIGVRGSVAVFVFGIFCPCSVEIVSASTLLWFINVGTPALIGYFVIAKFKENKNQILSQPEALEG